MNKLHFLVLFLVATSVRCNEDDDFETLSQNIQQVCGIRLEKFVSHVCNGMYTRPEKKSGHLQVMDEESMMDRFESHECKSLKMLEQFNNENEREQKALGFRQWQDVIGNGGNMAAYSRQRRGIVAECCRRPCTLKHIQEHYCEF